MKLANPKRCQTRKLMPTKAARLLFGLLLAALVLGIFLQMHLVVDWSGATVYSRENEAYILMGESHTGYHFPYIAYPFLMALQSFGAATSPSDEHAAALVLHITPTSLDQQIWVPTDLNHSSPLFVTPFEDGLYGMCPGGTLCKWTGKSFEPATPEQLQRIGGTDRLIRGGFGNQPMNGWVVHQSGRPGEKFTAQVGKDIEVTIQNHNKEASTYNWVTIDLFRPGQPPEHLYNVDGRKPRLVTKATYDHIFSTGGAREQATP